MTPFRLAPLLPLLAACSPDGAHLPPADLAPVEAEVREASLALLAALNAHEADSILAFYDRSDDFVQVACTDFVYGGRAFDAITRSLHHLYDDAVYDMQVRSVRALGPDAAVVTLEGTMLSPLFVTRVFRRDGEGRWLVTWEHESWPDCPGPQRPHPGAAP